MLRKPKLYQWPPPVYVARFAGGEECRMSVSSTIKGQYGFERARSIVCAVIGNERGRASRPVLPYSPEPGAYTAARPYRKYAPDMAWVTKNFPPADDIEAGHFEHDGTVIPDPFFTGEVAAAKPPKISALDRLIASLNKLSVDELARLSAEVDTRLLICSKKP